MNWLEKICEKEGFSFYQLSKRSGVAQSTLSNIRNKNIALCDVRIATGLAIAYGFDMSICELIDYVASIEFEGVS